MTAVAIPSPDGKRVRIIELPETAGDDPLLPDEGFILAQHAEIERLREALGAMVECSHTGDIPTCARASQLAAAALKPRN